MDTLSLSGSVLFTAAVSTVKELVVAAVKNGANLYGANLCGANLRSADLRSADLCGANLRSADLRSADLYGANLRSADLRSADLRGADLYGANLRSADLRSADLRGADLYGADLRSADLCGANLYGANLRSADLRGADLRGANLRGAKEIPVLAQAQTVILPEGNLVGWKKCRNGVIVKLLIPQHAKRSNALGRKCRASEVKVLRVFGAEQGISEHNSGVIYRKGETVKPHTWNEDRWTECGGGIHFFITRIEAENY